MSRKQEAIEQVKPVKPAAKKRRPALSAAATVEDYDRFGVQAAAWLRANPKALLQEAAAQIGISARTWRDWMELPGDKYEAFRAHVEPLYIERFKRDMSEAETAVNDAVEKDARSLSGIVKWQTWKLEKLHARVLGTTQPSVQINTQINANGGVEFKQMSNEELLEMAK